MNQKMTSRYEEARGRKLIGHLLHRGCQAKHLIPRMHSFKLWYKVDIISSFYIWGKRLKTWCNLPTFSQHLSARLGFRLRLCDSQVHLSPHSHCFPLECLGCMQLHVYIFRNCQTFPKWLHYFTFSPEMCEGSSFSTFISVTVII